MHKTLIFTRFANKKSPQLSCQPTILPKSKLAKHYRIMHASHLHITKHTLTHATSNQQVIDVYLVGNDFDVQLFARVELGRFSQTFISNLVASIGRQTHWRSTSQGIFLCSMMRLISSAISAWKANVSRLHTVVHLFRIWHQFWKFGTICNRKNYINCNRIHIAHVEWHTTNQKNWNNKSFSKQTQSFRWGQY